MVNIIKLKFVTVVIFQENIDIPLLHVLVALCCLQPLALVFLVYACLLEETTYSAMYLSRYVVTD